MAQIIHNIDIPDSGNGDQLRTAFDHQNQMNTELYDSKVDKVLGKDLSSNDYTITDKNKLDGIEEGAEVNIQANWNQNDDTQDDFIIGKPEQLFSSLGYFHHNDLATQTTALTLVANVEKKITNDTLGAQTNLTQAPYGVTNVWNSTTNSFDFSELSIGDTIDLRIDLTLTTLVNNQKYAVILRVGEGSTAQYDLLITDGLIKTSSSNNHIVGDVGLSLDYAEHLANPSNLYIVSDHAGSVNIKGFYTKILRKGINIITIGGDLQNLNDVLTEGNATDGENIFISNGDEISFDNSSRIRKGLTDAGNGGAKGVALVCSLDYELKWEAGRQYIMQQDGFTIREVSHNFTITPSATDDSTKGFAIDSRWILDNGDVYFCTDATEDSAVWELQVTDVQDFQNVTNIGNETTNPILIPELQLYDAANDAYAKINYFDGNYNFLDTDNRVIKTFDKDGFESTLNQNDFRLTKEISLLTANRTRIEPNKDGTYAMLDDILPSAWKEPAELLLLNADVVQSGGMPRISGLTIQGHTLVQGSRVVVTEYNVPAFNGIYRVAAGPLIPTGQYTLTRTNDANSTTELNNAVIGITNGTFGGKTYRQTTANPVINTTTINFVEFAPTITIDANPTDGSSNAVSSNGVFDALALKEDTSNKQNSLVLDGTGVKFPTIDAVNNLSFIDKFKRGIQYFTDFEGAAASTPYFSNFAIGGSVNRTANVPNWLSNQIGVAQYQTGVTSTGYFTHISEGFVVNQFIFGGGAWIFETYINVEILSTSLERFRFVSGFGNAATNGQETNGAFFTYDEGGIQNGTVASPNWQCVTALSSTRTLTTTTIPVTASTWVKLRIEVNALGTSVAFFINGNLVATHTTNIPNYVFGSPSRGFNVKQGILKATGTTNRSVFCDYLGYENYLTTSR